MRKKKPTPMNYLPWPERRKRLHTVQVTLTLGAEVTERLEKLMEAYGGARKGAIVALAIMAMRGPKGESMEEAAPSEEAISTGT
jgi:hypothetical protein